MSETQLLLGIDTCGPTGTVALGSVQGSELSTIMEVQLPGKTYSAQLLPAIRELLATHNATIAEIATIVVTNGPGRRAGVAVSGDVPLAVPRLAVLAHKAGATAAALDASRGEFYFSESSATRNEQLLTRDHFQQQASTLAHSLAVCEPSVHALTPLATLVAPPTAADALHFALPRLHARDFENPITLDGNYLRRSDAEIFSKPKSPASAAP